MDKTIRRITDLKEQRMETYRYWRSRSVGERLNAVREASIDAYAFKRVRIDDEQRSERNLVRIESVEKLREAALLDQEPLDESKA
jgi:hypothetical protein